ncbi:MAG: hypothetical protein U1D97_14100 [Desulfuromonadales bacterium]|nr:hypothetical protein [Desulfuromonadales bacterium]
MNETENRGDMWTQPIAAALFLIYISEQLFSREKEILWSGFSTTGD